MNPIRIFVAAIHTDYARYSIIFPVESEKYLNPDDFNELRKSSIPDVLRGFIDESSAKALYSIN